MGNFKLPSKPLEAQPEPEAEHVTQEIGELVAMPGLGLPPEACRASVRLLQPILAETLQLRDLYKKAHWQVQGPNFYSLHLLFDAHYQKQADFADMLAERIQTLGGVAVAQGVQAARISGGKPAPSGRECADAQISGLLEAHGSINSKCRKAARAVEEYGDLATADVLVTDVLRGGELEAWFLSSHLVCCKEA